jgi:hypothetical protein
MNTATYQKTVIALLCVCITLLAILLIENTHSSVARADVDSGNGYIAVPLYYSQSNQQLFLVKVTGENKAIMVYESKGGKGIKLVASRRIDIDSEIIAYNDGSEKGFHPIELKKELEKFNKREAEGR